MSVTSVMALVNKRPREDNDHGGVLGGTVVEDEERPRYPASDFVLTAEELDLHGFPSEQNTKDDATYRRAQPRPVDSLAPRVIAVDCEMCLTEFGSELTRVTLVDATDHCVLYDRLVKPHNPIVNYVTAFSGVTEEMLSNVTLDLPTMQEEILSKLIFEDTTLVGHSLENDMVAMRLVHKKIIDTSVIYTHPAGPPRKHALRYLAQKYLQRVIQMEATGHCSVEDASACIDLLALKRRHGKDFGNERSVRESILLAFQHHGVKCTLIDRIDNVKAFVTGNASMCGVLGDDQAQQQALKALGGVGDQGAFTFVHFTQTGKTEVTQRVHALVEAAGPRTVFIVLGLRPGDAPIPILPMGGAEGGQQAAPLWPHQPPNGKALLTAAVWTLRGAREDLSVFINRFIFLPPLLYLFNFCFFSKHTFNGPCL